MIDYINNLKYKYTNLNNNFQIDYNDIEKSNFLNIITKLKKYQKNIKILDNKVYINGNNLLYIDQNGNMENHYIKVLKYKYFNNIKVTLMNKRKVHTDNFNTSFIENEYKEKKIIYNIENINILLIIKMIKNKNSKKDEDKVITTYSIKLDFDMNENENNIKNVLKLLNDF